MVRHNKLSRNYFKRGISYLQRNGVAKSIYKATERLVRDRDEKDYSENFEKNQPTPEELSAQRKTKFNHPYHISILVPCYESDPVTFLAMVKSVVLQTYTNWELCILDASAKDDLRTVLRNFLDENFLEIKDITGVDIRDKVHYKFALSNKGIAGNTNEALDMAMGQYIALLDHDDLITPNALFEVMCMLNKKDSFTEKSSGARATYRLIYSDEDKTDYSNTHYFDYHQKPDFDPILLRTNNYVCHFLVVEKNLARSVRGFHPEYDGAQDHDFILRCTEDLSSSEVGHIPKVLYHWRSSANSTAENPEAKLYAYDAGKRAVTDHLRRMNEAAYAQDTEHLGFFKVIYKPNKGRVITMSTQEYLSLDEHRFRNLDAEYVMVLDDSLEPVNKDYINQMLSYMRRDKIGIVTGKIIGMNKKIESAGYMRDAQGKSVPCFAGLNSKYSGYLHRAVLQRICDDCDKGCMLVRLSAIECVNAKKSLRKGYELVYDPFSIFKRRKKV